jgi:hypothetical protein
VDDGSEQRIAELTRQEREAMAQRQIARMRELMQQRMQLVQARWVGVSLRCVLWREIMGSFMIITD